MPVITLFYRIDYVLCMITGALEQIFKRTFTLVQRFYILQRVPERHAHIAACDVLKRIFPAGDSAPVTADLNAAARHLNRITVARETLLDADIKRIAHARAVFEGIFQRAAQKFGVDFIGNAQSNINRYLQPVHGVEHDEAHAACHVAAAIGNQSGDLRIVCIVKEQAGDVPHRRIVIY